MVFKNGCQRGYFFDSCAMRSIFFESCAVKGMANSTIPDQFPRLQDDSLT